MRRPQLIWQLMTMTSMKDSVKQLTTCKSDPHLDCINSRDFSWTHLNPRICDYVSIIPIFYNSRRFKRFNESLTVDLLLYYQVLYKSWPCTHQLCRTLTMTSNDFCTVWMMLVHMLDMYRLEICRDRRDRRSCKIFPSCVKFWGNNANSLGNYQVTYALNE